MLWLHHGQEGINSVTFQASCLGNKHGHLYLTVVYRWTSQVVLVVKNPPANAGDGGSIPGSEKSPGKGNGNPFWYSCLENSMDRRAWQAIVHRVTKSWT